jgi:hypothetical protein
VRIFGPLAIATIVLTGCIFSEYDEEGRLRNISPEAMAALPGGMDPGFLVRDDSGCYLLVVDAGGAGVPLRNAAGSQVCDG